MSEPALISEESIPSVGASEVAARKRRLLALGVVLLVSFLHFIVMSTYSVFTGIYTSPGSSDLHQNQLRLASALIAELTSLMVLWYVLSQQGRTWRDIGWNPAWMDPVRGAGIIVLILIASYFANFHFQMFYRNLTGHYLQGKRVYGMLDFGISTLSIAIVLVNPFFEEIIVRAYTMSEVLGLSGSQALAVVISVSIQMSYHFYQGLLRSITLAITFTVFSLYFAKTRRILPVILAHLFFDAYALFSKNL